MRIILGCIIFILCHPGYASGRNFVEQAITSPCAACHGSNGQSLNPAWPHLAGQNATYLKKQLLDLKAGEKRHADPAMAPFILNLTLEDITNLAEFYASKPRPPGSHRFRSKNSLGEELYRVGNLEKHILPCITCHGEGAKGNEAAGFPSLRGQQLDYLAHQLEAFKSGERTNDPSQIMTHITAHMSAAEIHALAHYLASLPK